MSDERERALAKGLQLFEEHFDGGKNSVEGVIAWVYDAGQARAEQLERELAAERERVKELQQRVSDLKFALGDGAGWFDRYRAERTAHKATTDRLTKFADSQSAELQRFREQAQRENATLAADNERLCKELLEARNAVTDLEALVGRVIGDTR